MGIFAIGDIVILPFPYSDLSKTKFRPALVLSALDNNDYILAQITSKNYNNYIISITQDDLESGTLLMESYINYSKIFTCNYGIINKSIAKLNIKKFQEVIDKIIELLNNY